MEWLGAIFGTSTLFSWAWGLVAPAVLGGIWAYIRRMGVAVTQERIEQINAMAQARAGELITMVLSGAASWATLKDFALKLAKEALDVNPDIKARKGMTTDVMTKRILAEFGKLASSDPTIALPTPPAGATVGEVSVAGVSSSPAFKAEAAPPPFAGGSVAHRT